MITRKTHPIRNVFAAFGAAALLVAAASAQAGPEGSRVVAGEASIDRSAGHTRIEASNNAIIDHRSFDIGRDESVRFVQPDAASRVLNRITGGRPTLIEGNLAANGKVYFVNPQGITFAGTSVINANAIYAAAGHLSNQDFLAGNDRFTELNAHVINQGLIEGQRVGLFGSRVANEGEIRVGTGILTMVAGDTVYLREHGGRITVEVDGSPLEADGSPAAGQAAPGTEGDAGVENTGDIHAEGGSVMLGAGDMYSMAIRNRGRITVADGDAALVARDGAVVNSGEINASAEQAGTVKVEAPSVVHTGDIAADGDGGTVHVLSNDHTILGSGSRLSAAGSHGEVIVHSFDGHTVFDAGATIDVSGTHGGFIEVSGKHLSYHGDVMLDGATGNHGTLLIDPIDIFVVLAGDAAGDTAAADGTVNFADPSPADAMISASVLGGLPGLVLLEAERDIFIQSAITFQNNNTVLFRANRHVVFEAGLTGARALMVEADFNSSGEGVIAFDLPGGQSIVTSESQHYMGDSILRSDLTVTGTNIQFAGTLESTTADLINYALLVQGIANFDGHVGGASGATALRSVDVQSTANLAGNVRTTGDQDYRGNANLLDDVTLTGETVHFHNEIDNADPSPGNEFDLVVNAEDRAIFDGEVTDDRLVGSLTVNGRSEINGGSVETLNDQTYNGPVTIGEQDVELLSHQGDITLRSTFDAAPAAFLGATVLAEQGNITFDRVGSIDPLSFLTAKAGVNVGGIITITGPTVTTIGNILFNDPVDVVPDVATIAAPNGGLDIDVSDGNFTVGERNKVTALGDLNISAPAGITVADLNADGDITLTASQVNWLTRIAADLLDSDGDLIDDEGLDVVLNGVLTVNGASVLSGAGPTPRVGAPAAMTPPTGFDGVVIAPVPTTDFFFGETVLDLTIVTTPPNVDPADAIDRGRLPFNDRMVREALIGPTSQAALASTMAVNPRPLSAAEHTDSFDLRQFYVDISPTLREDVGAATRAVAINRVRRHNVMNALAMHGRVFGNGAGRTPAMRTALGNAWTGYARAVSADQQSAAGFAEFVAVSEAHAEAREVLAQLDRFFDTAELMGLSPLEFEHVARNVVLPVAPEDMDPAMLYQASRANQQQGS